MPETSDADVDQAVVMHETKGPLMIVPRPVGAASVRLALNEDGHLVYREFYLTGERDAEGRPIYRGRLA